ncbi:hypothetical protein TNCV_206661 [Trichonephila clavipes]|nr:hypothetical protein TNCV_206661 [Trichonephila clavipes]
MVSEQMSLRISMAYFLEIPKRRRTVSHEGIVTVLESYGEVNDDGLTVMLPQDQIGNKGGRDTREFLVNSNGTQMGRDGFRDTVLDGIVPSPPGSAVNLTVVQHMGDGYTNC